MPTETIKPRIVEIDYAPHAAQKEFHAAASGSRVVVGIAGIRSGKSMAGANEMIRRCLTAPERWCFVAPTFADARAILDYTVLAYLPAEAIAGVSANDHEIKLHNGSVILWRSAEEPERLRALGDLHGVWLDEGEQMKLVVFKIVEGRVARLKGRILVTTSPQKWFGADTRKRASWIYEYLREEGITIRPEQRVYNADDLTVVNWSLTDNPYFPADELQRLRDKYGPLWAAQELDGQYVDIYAEGVFLSEWFKTVPIPATFNRRLVVYDPAISEKGGADYSVALECAAAGEFVYVLREHRGHWNYVDQKIRLKGINEDFRPHSILIEDVAYQRALITDLQHDGLPIKAVKPDGDKASRASRLSGPLAAGKVLFSPEILTSDFINEFTAFPNWAHDDRVDALGYAVEELRPGREPFTFVPKFINDPAYA
jgi:predicted phage terminase large subunit-like protein